MVCLMNSKIVPIPIPQLDNCPRITCMMTPVSHYEIDHVQLADVDEVAKFVTSKRNSEHLSSRLLLEYALQDWGIDPSMVEVRRNQFRAPSIAYLPGTWRRSKLPSISICHSAGWAFVALIENGWTIGIDAELLELKISSGVFDMMANGDELDYLIDNPDCAVRLWTSKESIQKSARLGMHLNPRKIKIPIGESVTKIPIGNSIFQLMNFTFQDFIIAVSYSVGEGYDRNQEDDLLDITKQAMDSDKSWSIGCKTTRGEA